MFHPATNDLTSAPRCFEVQLGFARVTVESNDPRDAIRAARRRLCQELPRMWDVIQRLEESRFAVRAVE
jgi:hypothetical protein